MDIIYNPETPNVTEGLTLPSRAHTMIGRHRLNNIQQCLEYIFDHNIEGDCIEAGVWRGGACIFMKAVLTAHNQQRKVFVADSFQGFPPANSKTDKYPIYYGMDINSIDAIKISMEEVLSNFKKYSLLDDNVVFLKGWFKDSLNTDQIGKLSLIRLDSDLYESITDSITHLYPKLSQNGFIIVDDYYNIGQTTQAIEDYRSKHHITDPIIKIDQVACYWQKSQSSSFQLPTHDQVGTYTIGHKLHTVRNQ
jgi:hypothetical protein